MSNKYDKVLGKLREKDEITVDGGAVASVNGLAGEVVLTQDAIPDGTTYKQYSATEKTKLAGIAAGATANSSDATLLNRANHTGTQAISTILSLQGTLDSKAPASHTHDDRYYTETETNTLLSGKAASSHTHTASQVTDFDTEVSNNTDVAANTSARHTHANAVALAAVSGTNTGDQDLSGYATTAALSVKENISKVTPIAVSTSTAAGTAAKVATTTGGTYIPTEGDIIRVTFTAANTATNPTINIDGSGAKSILLGGANPTGVAMAGTKVMMWYDGAAFQLFGSQRVSDTDTNTTYSEITTAEIDAGTASTSRTITGRRVKYIQDKTLERAYPVNSIYISTVSTNPNTLFGFGTWVAYGEGRVIVGKAASGTFATAGATGGAETHTLSETEMPSHTHIQNAHNHTQASHTHTLQKGSSAGGDGSGLAWSSTAGTNSSGVESVTPTINNTTATNQNTGGGGAHNNLQPYIVAYIWHRTA